MVTNYEVVNSSIESNLKETQQIYKVKKDLKRLKFINDLPRVLENQLSLYLSEENKNIRLLEKSLVYYRKCKEFLNIHKENVIKINIYKYLLIISIVTCERYL